MRNGISNKVVNRPIMTRIEEWVYWIDRFKLAKIWRPSATPSRKVKLMSYLVQLGMYFYLDLLTNCRSEVIIWHVVNRLTCLNHGTSIPRRIISAASFDTSDPDMFMAIPRSAYVMVKAIQAISWAVKNHWLSLMQANRWRHRQSYVEFCHSHVY